MPARAFKHKLRASYFVPFLAMLLLAGIVLWRVSAQVSNVDSVQHTDQVIRDARHAQIELLKMTVDVRSYWLTTDKRYLTTLEDSERDLDATLAHISALVVDNPIQGQRLLLIAQNGWPKGDPCAGSPG